MPIKFQKVILRQEVIDNSEITYIFGDNELRQGMKGQAAYGRGLPNAIGIRTKRLPKSTPGAFWSDNTWNTNVKMIEQDIMKVETLLQKNRLVVFPEALPGTGYARLPKGAPRTFEYLKNQVKMLCHMYGEVKC